MNNDMVVRFLNMKFFPLVITLALYMLFIVKIGLIKVEVVLCQLLVSHTKVTIKFTPINNLISTIYYYVNCPCSLSCPFCHFQYTISMSVYNTTNLDSLHVERYELLHGCSYILYA